MHMTLQFPMEIKNHMVAKVYKTKEDATQR